jgi:hypothetical protein
MSPRDRSAAAVRADLLREAEAAVAQSGAASGARRVVRIELAVPPTDLLARLAAQPADTKWYWAARDNAWVTAGAGVAWRTAADGAGALDAVSAAVSGLIAASGDRVRVYGGMRLARLCECAVFCAAARASPRRRAFHAGLPCVAAGRCGARRGDG